MVLRPTLIFGLTLNFFIALLVENYLKTLFLAGLQSNSGLWIDVDCLSVCLSVSLSVHPSVKILVNLCSTVQT